MPRLPRPQYPVQGEQSRPCQDQGGQAQDGEREPEQPAEQGSPEDLGQGIDRALLEHPQVAGL
jgi:hypothetical protein